MSKKTEYKLKNERYMLDLQNKEGILNSATIGKGHCPNVKIESVAPFF